MLRVLPEDLDGIMIEVTEHEAVGDDEGFRRLLADMRARGARIALDDAGAGYAGLQAVMRLDLDVIKLDRSLVDGVHGDLAKVALVESFVRFARRTGAVVCAEGIETLDDLNVLADLDVTTARATCSRGPHPPGRRSRRRWPTSCSGAAWRVGATCRPASCCPRRATAGSRRCPGRMSRVASQGELPGLFSLIREELRADDLCFSNWDAARDVVKVYGDHG